MWVINGAFYLLFDSFRQSLAQQLDLAQVGGARHDLSWNSYCTYKSVGSVEFTEHSASSVVALS